MILLRYSGIPALDFTSVVDEDYGANDVENTHDDLDKSDNVDTITVPSINIELDESIQSLLVDPVQESSYCGVDLYLQTVNLLSKVLDL